MCVRVHAWERERERERAHTLGLISMVRKSLKLVWGASEWNFFSSWTSHWGARWTFLRSTQRPALEAEEMAFSARLKPSAEPEGECRMMVSNISMSTVTTLYRPTYSNGCTLFAELSSKVVNSTTGIVARDRAEKDGSVGLDLMEYTRDVIRTHFLAKKGYHMNGAFK